MSKKQTNFLLEYNNEYYFYNKGNSFCCSKSTIEDVIEQVGISQVSSIIEFSSKRNMYFEYQKTQHKIIDIVKVITDKLIYVCVSKDNCLVLLSSNNFIISLMCIQSLDFTEENGYMSVNIDNLVFPLNLYKEYSLNTDSMLGKYKISRLIMGSKYILSIYSDESAQLSIDGNVKKVSKCYLLNSPIPMYLYIDSDKNYFCVSLSYIFIKEGKFLNLIEDSFEDFIDLYNSTIKNMSILEFLHYSVEKVVLINTRAFLIFLRVFIVKYFSYKSKLSDCFSNYPKTWELVSLRMNKVLSPHIDIAIEQALFVSFSDYEAKLLKSAKFSTFKMFLARFVNSMIKL